MEHKIINTSQSIQTQTFSTLISISHNPEKLLLQKRANWLNVNFLPLGWKVGFQYCSAYRTRSSGPVLTADSTANSWNNGFSDHFWNGWGSESTLPKSAISSKWGQVIGTQEALSTGPLSWRRQRPDYTHPLPKKQPRHNWQQPPAELSDEQHLTKLGSHRFICNYLQVSLSSGTET